MCLIIQRKKIDSYSPLVPKNKLMWFLDEKLHNICFEKFGKHHTILTNHHSIEDYFLSTEPPQNVPL